MSKRPPAPTPKSPSKSSAAAVVAAAGATSPTSAMSHSMVPEQSIDIDHILESEHQARSKSGLQSAAIEELAQSMQKVGMLQPVGVRATGDKGMYELLWGHRRLLAAKRLGWRSISAVVVDELSALNAIDITIIENAQRSELSPVEEAVAVSSKLDSLSLQHNSTRWMMQTPDVRDEIVTQAANALGKSPTWVRDRAYLARCAPKIREMVQDGRLPLTHAREIAKVVEHEQQEEVAFSVCAEIDKAGTIIEPAASLEDVKDLVGRRVFSLPQAPWKLDVAVGSNPPCTTCPHNSANQPGLFEHGGMASADPHAAKSNYGRKDVKPDADGAPEKGVCLKHSCYMAKTQTVRAMMANAAKKATDALEEVPKKDREKNLPAVAKQHAPAIVKPAAFKDRVQERAQRIGNRSSSGTQSSRAEEPANQIDWQLKHKAQDAFRKIEEKYEKEFNALLAAAFAKKPGLFTIVLAFLTSRPFRALESSNSKSLATALKSPKLATLVQACRDVAADASIRKVEAECPIQHDLLKLFRGLIGDEWSSLSPEQYSKLAAACGFEDHLEVLPEETAWIDAEYKRLLAAKNAPKPAASAKPSKGKKAAASTTTQGVKTIADMRRDVEEAAAAKSSHDDEEDLDS